MDGRDAVAARRNWVYAGTYEEDGILCLAVYRSVRAEDGDACMRPVRSYLDVFCYIMPVAPEYVEDVTMMGGAAIRERYIVLQTCPGDDVTHQCNMALATAVIGN